MFAVILGAPTLLFPGGPSPVGWDGNQGGPLLPRSAAEGKKPTQRAIPLAMGRSSHMGFKMGQGERGVMGEAAALPAAPASLQTSIAFRGAGELFRRCISGKERVEHSRRIISTLGYLFVTGRRIYKIQPGHDWAPR